MKTSRIFMALSLASGIAYAKQGITVIDHKVYPVNVTVNEDRLYSPYRPFDGDVALSLGDDFRLYHKLPIHGLFSEKLPLDNQIVAYFAPGNTFDVLIYEANNNNGKLPGTMSVTLGEEITEEYVQLDPKICFHCHKKICAKGITEKVELEIPGPNTNVKTVSFTSVSKTDYQEIPPENCAD